MKKILLLATGGTIASRNLGEGLTPALTAEELLGCVPEIAGVCDVLAEQVCNLDSTNMRPEHWVRIARRGVLQSDGIAQSLRRTHAHPWAEQKCRRARLRAFAEVVQHGGQVLLCVVGKA